MRIEKIKMKIRKQKSKKKKKFEELNIYRQEFKIKQSKKFIQKKCKFQNIILPKLFY